MLQSGADPTWGQGGLSPPSPNAAVKPPRSPPPSIFCAMGRSLGGAGAWLKVDEGDFAVASTVRPASGYWSPTPHQSWPAYATAQRIRSAQSQTKWPIRPGNPTKISNPTTSPRYPWQQPGSRSAATQRDLGAGQLGERCAGPEPDVRRLPPPASPSVEPPTRPGGWPLGRMGERRAGASARREHHAAPPHGGLELATGDRRPHPAA